MRQFLRAKLHGARITQADLHYEGSLGIDRDLMDAVGIAPFEVVEVYNITNGARLKTYCIELERGSKQVTSNGAAAHLMKPEDEVIIVTYHYAETDTVGAPRVAIVNAQNEIKRIIPYS